MRKLVWIGVLLGLALASSANPAQKLFDEVNSLLQSYYGGFSQVRPADLKQKYQPELDKLCAGDSACPTNKVFPLIKNMVGEMGDRHTNYLTPPEYAETQQRLAGGNTVRPSLGVQIQALAELEGILITEVYQDSPAAQAGLKRWDRIMAVGGEAVPAPQGERVAFLRDRVSTGEPLQLTIQRGKEQLEVRAQGRIIPTLQLPYLNLRPDGVAVLRIPSFTGLRVVGSKIHELVKNAQLAGAKQMIVDLRGNGGGYLSECLVGAGAFVDETFRRLKGVNSSSEQGFKNGAYYDRVGNREFSNYSVDPAKWTGPVAVLVDRGTASCAEYFAFDLQDGRSAPIIGQPTAGVGNTTTLYLGLSDGSGLQVSTTQAQKQDGTPYPERVTPSVLLDLDVQALAEGRDAALERAVGLLQTAKAP